MLTTFLFCFIIMMFGSFMPEDVIHPSIVGDFLRFSDLELKIAVVGTVLFPPQLGQMLGYGADHGTVLMALAWGVGGLVAGLMSRDIVQGVFSAIFAVIIGALLTWLLIFFVQTVDYAQILGSMSLRLMQMTFEGSIYPGIASVIGGLLGGAITRERR